MAHDDVDGAAVERRDDVDGAAVERRDDVAAAADALLQRRDERG